MAIRVKSGSGISMRIEPSKSAKLDTETLTKLKLLGFGVQDGGEYVSQHFKAEGGTFAGCGAYGAVC